MASRAKLKIPAKKVGGAKKKGANGYVMPSPIPLGEVLTDNFKKSWKVGPSIGTGGFGEIYSACKLESPTKNLSDYPFVIKIEPHGNGPLFVEMHFYMRNAKQEDIEKFRKTKGLKSIGMPHFVGSGSHDLDKLKHRFIIMPRYGCDIWKIFLENNRYFPQHTIYRVAIQMIAVLEYIHQCTYIHGDIKGANILLGFGKNNLSQVYLVDFGLACHYTTKDFKPDPKKMHNGTIEYTSRDAHNGVPTMRSDLEILLYNLIHWSGGALPWETNKLLGNPPQVQASKEKSMSDIKLFLKTAFTTTVPGPILQFAEYVCKLKYNDSPEYTKCSKIFEAGIKELGKTNSGDLDFSALGKTKPVEKVTRKRKSSVDSENKPEKTKVTRGKKLPEIIKIQNESDKDSSTPERGNKVTKRIKINKGSTVIKNDIKAGGDKTKKTYEFNFELDVSLDADVVVRVNRKRKSSSKIGDNKINNSAVLSDVEIIPESDGESPLASRKRRQFKKNITDSLKKNKPTVKVSPNGKPRRL